MKKHLIILAGGSGQRLWPLSTSDLPKQFLKNVGDLSLFQQSIDRNQDLFDHTIILSQEKYFFPLVDQIVDQNQSNIQLILEPFGRGTLPILILSLLNLAKEDFFFVTPSDHRIINKDLYKKNLRQNLPNKTNNKLFIIGKKPLSPHTGYGYILHEHGKVIRFVEKPNLTEAQSLIENDNILWNCGMLFAKVSDFLDLVKELQPDIYQICLRLDRVKKIENLKYPVTRYLAEEFWNAPNISIDKAILELVPNLKVIEAEFDWRDCGSIETYLETRSLYNNLTLLNAKNISVSGIKQKIVVQNAQDLAIIEKDESLFIIKI